MADKTANEKILDAYTGHQMDVGRYAKGLGERYIKILMSTANSLSDSLYSFLRRKVGRGFITKKDKEWKKRLTEMVRDNRNPAWKEILDDYIAEMYRYERVEVATGARIIEAATPVIMNLTLPPVQQLNSLITSQPYEGGTLREWINNTARADVQRIIKETRNGVVQGLTPDQIVRNIIGTKSANFKDGELNTANNQIESVVITVTNGIQNAAKQELYIANEDIITEQMYVATLDAHTTLICASNDGKIFKTREGPIPPLHFRCRSVRVPILTPEGLYLRPFDPSNQKEILNEFTSTNGLSRVTKRADLPRGTKGKFDVYSRKRKRELVGQVPAKVDFNEFLMGRSLQFQNDYLGITRAKMFRKGDIHLDRFVARDGDTLTIDELEKRGLEIPS